MKFGMSLGHHMHLEQRLNQQQKMELKSLLEIRCTLKCLPPRIPNQGVHGIYSADQVLKENKSAGILIGGLSERICSQYNAVNDMMCNKDVDVMVIQGKYRSDDFESGIDWWNFEEGRIRIERDTGYDQLTQKWYRNGNGVILKFKLTVDEDLESGLYFMNSSQVIQMRLVEALSSVDSRKVDVDGAVIDEYREKLAEIVNGTFPDYILKEYGDHKLDPETVGLSVEGVDLPTMRAIKTYLKGKA